MFGAMPDAHPAPADYVVYTDGGCHPNPGRGGWGVVVLQAGKVIDERSGGAPDTTNNRMELTAAAEALRALPDGARADIHTDSTYVRDGISKWIAAWRRRGWTTKDGGAVKNQDLWCLLDELASQRQVQWHWVRGHTGDRYNERADALASAALRGTPLRAADRS